MIARVSSAVAAILDAALRGEPTETQAQQLYAYGPEAVALVLLTITRHADVPYENNFAERQIRPAVILRKNSLSNRSERGASMQAVLMSVYHYPTPPLHMAEELRAANVHSNAARDGPASVLSQSRWLSCHWSMPPRWLIVSLIS